MERYRQKSEKIKKIKMARSERPHDLSDTVDSHRLFRYDALEGGKQRIVKNIIQSVFVLLCLSLCTAPVSHAGEIEYSFPVQPVKNTAFSKGGHSYPAIDIFCKQGTVLIAPVSGVIEDIQKNDEWTRKTNDPDKKGGKWVSLLGDDGFRYYGSHLENISEDIYVGQHVKQGYLLGYTGNSGDAKGTPHHLHFGISLASKPYDWRTRRGEIEPYYFLRCILRKGCSPQTILSKEKKHDRGLP